MIRSYYLYMYNVDIWANPSAPCVDSPTAAMLNLYELVSSVP